METHTSPKNMNTLEKVQQIFAQQLGLDNSLFPATRRLRSIYEQGEVDSLGVIEIILDLEENFELDISDMDVTLLEPSGSQHTVADLVNFLDARRPRRG